MALTITDRINGVLGTDRVRYAQVAFDSAYAYGGESLAPGDLGLARINRLQIDPKSGYTFEWDKTNEKIKVFAPAPAIVIDEAHTIASNAITLDYPAAAILNLSTAAKTQLLIDAGDTPAADECKLTAAMAAGTRTGITFHASTSGAVKTSYITQAWQEVWVNRHASSAFATSTSIADLDDTACFIESMTTLDTSGSVVTSRSEFVRGGDVAAAGECEVDWTDSGAAVAGDTTLTFVSTDAVTDITLTYISLPASGFLKDRFIEDEDLTIASLIGSTALPMLFNATCGQIPDFTDANEREVHHLLMPEGDDLATTTGECAIDWHKMVTLRGTQVRVKDASSDAVSMTYVYGVPGEIPGLVPLEVKNATNLAALTGVRIMAIGQ